jgi:hypothetical protein
MIFVNLYNKNNNQNNLYNGYYIYLIFIGILELIIGWERFQGIL